MYVARSSYPPVNPKKIIWFFKNLLPSIAEEGREITEPQRKFLAAAAEGFLEGLAEEEKETVSKMILEMISDREFCQNPHKKFTDLMEEARDERIPKALQQTLEFFCKCLYEAHPEKYDRLKQQIALLEIETI